MESREMQMKIFERLLRRISMLFSPQIRSIDSDHHMSVMMKPPTPNVFIVTSTIHFGGEGLSYSSRRSIYSPEDRLQQTLRSLESVRLKNPGCYIVLVENSELTGRDIKQLQEHVDWLICFSNSPNAITLRDGLYKGAGEVYMILKCMEVLRYFNYEKLFKLSGRYCLTERFKADSFPLDRFGVLKTQGVYSTRLYCVPKCVESIYLQQLGKMLKSGQRGVSIEAVFMRGVSLEQIAEMPCVGVSGCIGVNGIFIDE
jgi:hypothetical protein